MNLNHIFILKKLRLYFRDKICQFSNILLSLIHSTFYNLFSFFLIFYGPFTNSLLINASCTFLLVRRQCVSLCQTHLSFLIFSSSIDDLHVVSKIHCFISHRVRVKFSKRRTQITTQRPITVLFRRCFAY